MRIFACLLCIALLVASGCSRDGKEEVISSFPGGARKMTGIFQGKEPNRAQLKGFEYYESGEKKKELSFRDNHFYGPWTFWYKSGKKMAEGVIEAKTLDHQAAVGSGTYYWPSGAKMIEISTNREKSASEVTAIYDEAGRQYTVANKPPELAEKIKDLLEKWEKGAV